MRVKPGEMPRAPWLLPELVGERFGVINISKGFANGTGMHAGGAGLFVAVEKVTGQGLDVAIENQTDKFELFVDHWTA